MEKCRKQKLNFAKNAPVAAKLARNISYLGLSQIANYLFPLLTIPYITRVVGPENYGLIEFAAVTLVYFIGLVDYSFNSTATRRIAASQGNKAWVATLFSAVLYAKVLLLILSMLLLAGLILGFAQFREQAYLLSLAFPVVIGWALYPNFFLRGVEKVGVVALTNLGAKGGAALLIFTLLQSPDQYHLVPLINGLTQVGAAVFALLYCLFKIPGAQFTRFRIPLIRRLLYEGRFVFLSNFFTRIYGFSSLLLGSFFLPEVQLGIFAASAKLITVAQSSIFQPLQGALFPHLSRSLSSHSGVYRAAHRQASLRLLLLAGLATILLFLLAPWLVQLIFGEDYSAAAPLLRLMAPMLVVGAIAHMCLQQGLLLLRRDRLYMYIIGGAAILSIGLNLVLIPALGMQGAALSKMLVEAALAAGAAIFFYLNLPAHAPR